MDGFQQPPGLDTSPWQVYLNWLGFACCGYTSPIADARRLAGDDHNLEVVIFVLNKSHTTFEIAWAYDLAEANLDTAVTHAIRDAVTCLFLLHSLNDKGTFVNILQTVWYPLSLHRASLFSATVRKCLESFGVEPWRGYAWKHGRRRDS